MKLLVRSTLYVVVLTVLLGGVYPAVVTAVSHLFWKEKAEGSFVRSGGRVVGSELIGQAFSGPRYLHPRPSAAGKDGYDATASGGRNKGPIDADLAKFAGKLANPAFLAKAKPEIIAEQREREADTRRDRDRLQAAYERLGAV